MSGGPIAAPFEVTLANNTRRDEAGCWIWTKDVNYKGYGIIHRTKDRRAGAAHRWVWENLRGPIPAGLHLDHLCRNRACVNPEHLEPVTPRENNLRSSNARKAACQNGHPFDVITPQGHRVCSKCKNAARRRRRATARAVAQ